MRSCSISGPCPYRQRRNPALVRAHTSAERQGGKLTIVNANEQVRSLFLVSHLDKVLHLGDGAGAGS